MRNHMVQFWSKYSLYRNNSCFDLRNMRKHDGTLSFHSWWSGQISLALNGLVLDYFTKCYRFVRNFVNDSSLFLLPWFSLARGISHWHGDRGKLAHHCGDGWSNENGKNMHGLMGQSWTYGIPDSLTNRVGKLLTFHACCKSMLWTPSRCKTSRVNFSMQKQRRFRTSS